VARPEGRLTAIFAARHGFPKNPQFNVTGIARRGQVRCAASNLPQGQHDRLPYRDPILVSRRSGTTIIAGRSGDGGSAIASHQELSAFLAEVERRAFKQALFAVRDEEAALDIVQDAMLKLAEKYAAKPAQELPMLFQRILQNTIHDHFRRRKVRATWTTLLSAFGQKEDKDEDFDPLETLPARSDSNSPDPAQQHQQAEIVTLVERALARLPARQREAFLLRYWEELDVAETATAMGCSEGSVKTHCSRAVHALAEMLKAKGVSL
jgi:RNA polymerase sigma-70 factor (ECF subfamily)